jgi:hypothetical protein
MKAFTQLTNHSFVLKEMNTKYDGKSGRKVNRPLQLDPWSLSADCELQNEWMLLLQRNEPEHDYGQQADISVLSGRTLLAVCSSPPALGLVSEDM